MKKNHFGALRRCAGLTLALLIGISANTGAAMAASEEEGSNLHSESLRAAYSRSYSGFSVFDMSKYTGPGQAYEDYPKYRTFLNADYEVLKDDGNKKLFSEHIPVNMAPNTATQLMGLDSEIKDSGDIQTYEGLVLAGSVSVPTNTVTLWLDDARLGFEIYQGNTKEPIYSTVQKIREGVYEKRPAPSWTNAVTFHSHQEAGGKTAYYFEIDSKKSSVESQVVVIAVYPLLGGFEAGAEPSSYAVWTGSAVEMKYQASPITLRGTTIRCPSTSAVTRMNNTSNSALPKRGYLDRLNMRVSGEQGDTAHITSTEVTYSTDGSYYKDLPTGFTTYSPTPLRGSTSFQMKVKWYKGQSYFYYMYNIVAQIEAVTPLGV